MTTTDKRPLKVFLCHAHADRDAVRGLYTRLTQDGVDRSAWLDKEKLLPGGLGVGNPQSCEWLMITANYELS